MSLTKLFFKVKEMFTLRCIMQIDLEIVERIV